MLLSRMRDQLLPISRAASGMQEYGLDLIDQNAVEGINPFEKYSILSVLTEHIRIFFSARGNFRQHSMIQGAILETFNL
jgi:hypothetical protein